MSSAWTVAPWPSLSCEGDGEKTIQRRYLTRPTPPGGASGPTLTTSPIPVITSPIPVITSPIRVITMADPGDHDGPIRVITMDRSR